MKRSHLLVALLMLSAISSAAQERPRFYDNFDIPRGVQVYRPASFTPVAAKPKLQATAGKGSMNKKLLAKTVDSKVSRMSVAEGLAERESGRSEYNRLSMGSASHLKGFTTGNPTIDGYIVESSRRYNVDPLLIYAQMHQESSFKLRALSYKGASGLMQLMPGTARRLGVTDIYDPKQNIEGGVKYMRMLLDMFGQDVNLALAGYNAGEGAVMKYGYQIPPYNETREYVRRISARYMSISDGSYARTVRRVNSSTATKLEQKNARPLTVYEPSPVAIRLADGRMRLVNQ